MSRANRLSTTITKQDYFSDFLNNFDSHPITNALARTTNENAVKQSLRNLILTDLGERLFQPNIGSDVSKSLFEPNDLITAQNIDFFIKNTIKYNEPRVLLLHLDVIPRVDNSSFEVNLVFSLINNSTPITMSIILRRVR